MLLMSLVCPRVLSPECGTGLLRPEMLGICMLGGGGGGERSTNEVQDRFLVVQARRHRFDNATTLRKDFQNATILLGPKMTGPQSCLQTSPGFVWTLPIDVLGYGECQMSVFAPICVAEHDRFGGGSVMVWAGISAQGKKGPPRH